MYTQMHEHTAYAFSPQLHDLCMSLLTLSLLDQCYLAVRSAVDEQRDSCCVPVHAITYWKQA